MITVHFCPLSTPISYTLDFDILAKCCFFLIQNPWLPHITSAPWSPLLWLFSILPCSLRPCIQPACSFNSHRRQFSEAMPNPTTYEANNENAQFAKSLVQILQWPLLKRKVTEEAENSSVPSWHRLWVKIYIFFIFLYLFITFFFLPQLHLQFQ